MLNLKNLIYSIFVIFFLWLINPHLIFAQSNFDFFFGGDKEYQDVVVERVISADTIKLEEGEVVKLIGLKALEPPEKERTVDRDQYGFRVKQEINPIAPLEKQAFQFAVNLIEGKHIRLEFDTEKKNDQLQTLAYVFILDDDTFVNTEILRQGFASLHIRPPNTKHAKQLRAAYTEAREERRGIQGQ